MHFRRRPRRPARASAPDPVLVLALDLVRVSVPASLAQPSLAARSLQAAITTAAGSVSTMLTEILWVASGFATEWFASDCGYASGTGASSTPCRNATPADPPSAGVLL